MRHIFILLIGTLVGVQACKEEDESLQAQLISVDDITGDWTITRFISGGDDISNQFGNDVILNISTNGGLFFENSPTSDFGSWFIEGGDSLRIDIANANHPYTEFEDIWAVIAKSENSLELLDIDDLNDVEGGEGGSSDADGDTSERVSLSRVQEQ